MSQLFIGGNRQKGGGEAKKGISWSQPMKAKNLRLTGGRLAERKKKLAWIFMGHGDSRKKEN